jgi:hypothetical protein
MFEYYVIDLRSVKNLKSRLFTLNLHYNIALSLSFIMPSPTTPKIDLEDPSIIKAQLELEDARAQLNMAKNQEPDLQTGVAARNVSDRQPSAPLVQVQGGSTAVGLHKDKPIVSKPTTHLKTAGGKEKERRVDSEGSQEEGRMEEEPLVLKVGRKGKERELDDSEEGGGSKKSGEEKAEASDGDSESDEASDEESESEEEEEEDELESVKSQGAPPQQKVVPGTLDCLISSIFFLNMSFLPFSSDGRLFYQG